MPKPTQICSGTCGRTPPQWHQQGGATFSRSELTRSASDGSQGLIVELIWEACWNQLSHDEQARWTKRTTSSSS